MKPVSSSRSAGATPFEVDKRGQVFPDGKTFVDDLYTGKKQKVECITFVCYISFQEGKHNEHHQSEGER